MKIIAPLQWYRICETMSAWDEYWIYCDVERLHGVFYKPRINDRKV